MKKRLLSTFLLLLLVLSLCQIPSYAGSALIWPVPASKTISQGYHDNNAIDIAAPVGTPVVAAMGGTVTSIFLCTQTHYNYGDCNGFGTGLVILGDDGRAYQYAHMKGGSIPSTVYRGARVNAGQQIGCVGQTGFAYGPHLHFGISRTSNYWEAGPNPANETYVSSINFNNIYIGNQSVSNLSDKNAKLSATLYKEPAATASACGIYLGLTAGGMTKRNTEALGSATNNYNRGKSFNIWYDLTGELGIVLSPGTTYYYKFYCIVNGREISGQTASFRTTGGSSASGGNSSGGTLQENVITAQNVTRSASTWPQSFQIGAKQKGNGKLTYQSNSKYVKVSSSGKVTIAANFSGTASIQISAPASGNYKAATRAITVTVAKKSQSMKVSPGSVTCKAKNLKKLPKAFLIRTSGCQGKVTITSNSKYVKVYGRIATVKRGTPKGTYTLQITAAGNSVYTSSTKAITIRVN